TIVIARFMPIVRTFAPVVAGAASMTYRKFVVYNVIGGVGWVFLMTLGGFYLGKVEWIQKNLEKAIVIVILFSISPMIIHFVQHRLPSRREAAAAAISTVLPRLEPDGD